MDRQDCTPLSPIQIASGLERNKPEVSDLETSLKQAATCLIARTEYWLTSLHEAGCIRPVAIDQYESGLWIDWRRAYEFLSGHEIDKSNGQMVTVLTVACSLAGKGSVNIQESAYQLEEDGRSILLECLRRSVPKLVC